MFGDLTIAGGPLGPKERSLLAALALRLGSIVTPGELAEAVWGDDAPTTWPKQLQALIVHIRRVLGRTAVVTSRSGYRLTVDSDAIDAVRFERLLGAARQHRADGDPARAIDAIERAFALWLGPPYVDLAEWPPALLEAARLGEVRATAEEDLLEARLELGEHRAVVADAEHLVRSAPLRERRWAIVATALYRSGRQADALATLRSARTRLADELGIEPGAELIALESAILRHEASLDAPAAPPQSNGECPYRGLLAFGAEDAATFFGRDADIQLALARLRGSSFLALAGSSGCGKSSLMLAGLVPSLRSLGRIVVVVGSGRASSAAIRDALSDRRGADVVVIDQFEELLNAGLPIDEVGTCCRLIADAVEAGRTVIVAVRSDYLDACAAEPSIGPLVAQGVHLVGPLSPAGLRSAIEQPAHLAGLRLETGLVELVLRDAAGEPGALPHVSHALVETWLRREGSTLTVAGYEESGGISGAIAQSADQLYQSLDPRQQLICRATLLRLVEIGSDGAPMRRRIRIEPLRKDAIHEQVLIGLERARLVSAEEDTLVVAHESLATAWPRLRGWLESDADGARVMHALDTAASMWEMEGRPDEGLFRGARLQSALEWQDSRSPELTAVEADFLSASRGREQAAAAELARRATHDRRQNRRLRALLFTTIAMLAVAATAGGLVALSARETAAQRTEATIEALTSTSLSLRTTERDVSALLAVEAHRRWPDDPRTHSALMGAMEGANGLLRVTYVPGVREMVGRVVPGTRLVAVVTDTRRTQLFDLDTGELVRTLDIERGGADLNVHLGPVVSADGRLVAVAEQSASGDGPALGHASIRFADVASGAMARSPVELEGVLSSIAISPDGTTVAAIDSTGALSLVDAVSGTVRTVIGVPTHAEVSDSDRAGTIGFTPAGLLVYGTVAGDALLIDPPTGVVTAHIALPAASANVSMSVLSDSLALVTGDRRISALDLSARSVSWSQQFEGEQGKPCPWLAASSARDSLYCGDLWGRIEERSLSAGVPTGRHLDLQFGFVGALAVSADGRKLDVVGRGTAAFSQWMLDDSGPATRVIAEGWRVGDGYSVTGSQVLAGVVPPDSAASGAGPSSMAVIDTVTGDPSFTVPDGWAEVGWTGDGVLIGRHGTAESSTFRLLSARTGRDWGMDFAPGVDPFFWPSADGTKLYAGDHDGAVYTLDPATGRRIGPTFRVEGRIQSASTNSTASRVLFTSYDPKLGFTSSLYDGTNGRQLRGGLLGPVTAVLTERGEIVGLEPDRVSRYDAETFEFIGELPGIPGGLARISVSSDGRSVAAFSQNGTVSLYDVESGIRLGEPIRVASPEIWAAFIRPDGQELAVNATGGIAVWDLRPEKQAEAACRMAGRDLTRDEWKTYLADIGPYRSSCGFGGG
ncbi:DNA-binding SARP family transcriptional activator [Microterricola gilva]|uniref:DNA-binding SARP family transcriptional activator n=1 Tax=Microterricola gilva TaxID=393267 RepID=A0A4Q8AL17_9MICO|nr:DNA-binding SARP family transcriptional activator [Microterricola gilva]